jgi:hypothetical protein
VLVKSWLVRSWRVCSTATRGSSAIGVSRYFLVFCASVVAYFCAKTLLTALRSDMKLENLLLDASNQRVKITVSTQQSSLSW